MLIEGTEVRVYAESADEALTITDEIRTEKQLTAVLLTGNYPKPARGNSIRYIHRPDQDHYRHRDVQRFHRQLRGVRGNPVGLYGTRSWRPMRSGAFRKAVVTMAWKGQTLRDIFLDIVGDPDIASLGCDRSSGSG